MFETWMENFLIEILKEYSQSNKEVYRDLIIRLASMNFSIIGFEEDKLKEVIKTIPNDFNDLYSLFLTHINPDIRKITTEAYLEKVFLDKIIESAKEQDVNNEDFYDWFENNINNDEYWKEIIEKILDENNKIEISLEVSKNHIVKYILNYLLDLNG